MTVLEEVLDLLDEYYWQTGKQQSKDLLLVASETLAVRRTIVWLCERCGEALRCEYIRYDPSVYPVRCRHCQQAYALIPGKGDYGITDIQRLPEYFPLFLRQEVEGYEQG